MKTPDCWHYWEAADRSFTSDEWAAPTGDTSAGPQLNS